MAMINMCEKCTNGIVDAKWGNCKCGINEVRIYSGDGKIRCKDYKKGKPTESKYTADYYKNLEE